MRKNLKRVLSAALALCLGFVCTLPNSMNVKAENPIVQTMYTADPSPLVVGDTLYVYTTRDEHRESATEEWSLMNEWRCFSTKDMINWTDHGQIAHLETFDGDKNFRAWAQHVVEWDGKYYLFAPINGQKIDVAVSDNPWGPFEDATPGKYLIDGQAEWTNIDPAILIDDHGNPDDLENCDIYLYWGNPYLRYCKLTNDLLDVDPDTDGDGIISEEEGAIDPRFSPADNRILGETRPGLHSFNMFGDEGYQSFGEPTQGKDQTGKFPAEPSDNAQKRCAFEEGPWVLKHDDGKEGTDDYFMFFVGGRTPGETVEYSTAPSPLGPWTYRGLVMARENGYSCIHPGVVEYKGHNYLFYLNEMLVGGNGSDRSVCVKEFNYDENNLIVKETPEDVDALMQQGMESTVKGTPYYSVDALSTLNPYVLNQAETICWTSNLDGVTGGFNGTGQGVKTKSKQTCHDTDSATGKEAFWKSAALYGVAVCDIDHNDYIKVAGVDFSDSPAETFTVSAACGKGTPLTEVIEDKDGNTIFNPEADTVSGTIELWIDYGTDTEKQIGSVEISDTGSTNTYRDFTTELTEGVTGVHDLYFIFKGDENSKLFNLDTWQFTHKEPLPPATPGPQTPGQTPVPQAPVQQTPAPQTPGQPQASVSPSSQPDIKKPEKAKILSAKKKGKANCSIKLKKQKNISGFQIVYSTDKSFRKNVKKRNIKSTSYTIKKLKTGRRYYIKARACVKSGTGKTYYGKFSGVKKIKI